MAFLSFIQNRHQQSSAAEPQSQSQVPATIQQKVAQQAAQDKALRPSVEALPPETKAQAVEAAQRLKHFEHQESGISPAPTPRASETTERPEALRQAMTGQDKGAPAMSPTDGQMGKTGQEQTAHARSSDAPAKETEGLSPSAPPTPNMPARNRGGWER